MRKVISLGTAVLLFITTLAFANNSNASDNNVTRKAPQNTLHLSDNDQPPGFRNSDNSAQGLINQDKTPYGWSQGKKRGWNKNHHKHYKHHDNNGYGNHENGNNGHGNNGHGNNGHGNH